jgi:rod shape-determining protein MreB
MKDGVIADYRVTEAMLRYFISKALGKYNLFKPDVMVSVPAGITSTERRAVVEAAIRAGAKNAYVVKEPILAAIGAGISIHEPKGHMIVDIGGGTTEIAVIALGGIVCDKSVKIAGDVFTNDIVYYMRTQHNLFVGESSAEKIKIQVGAAVEDLETAPEEMSVQGRDLLTGKPKRVDVSYREIAKALDKSIQRIEDAVMETLSQTPPELSADIYNTGIYLAGGGSMLRGLDKRISMKTDLPVYIAEDPLRAVVRGTGMTLKNINKYKGILIK